MKESGTQNRAKLLKLNTLTSLVSQVVTVLCGFILPRLILGTYGSEVNGLVNSILQFLQIIAFLELGVGAVVQSALYKPLADKDANGVSRIIVSAQKFFTRLALILLVYVVGLMVVYPFVAAKDFDWLFTALLIAAISISSFAQYYFGVVDSILLRADQRGYIQYTAQIATTILNTVACVILIKLGAGIHWVKLTTSLLYLLRPLVMRWYINRHYGLNRRIKYEGEPIKQKWNGIAQHVAAVLIDVTDTIVLTLFSKLANVSIYSVYHLVIYGVKNLFFSLTNGVQALIGELWAKQELDELNKAFGWFEWLIHTGTVFFFGCTGMLVVPFVAVYTFGLTDADYIQPVFAALIVLAHAGHSLRLPYSIMILAGGHYKQTQWNYIIAAVMNIVLSIAMVAWLGLEGVAIGTLVSMLFQTVWMAWYISKNLNKWPFKRFLKQIAVDVITVALAIAATFWIPLLSTTYLSWVLLACEVAALWILVIFLVNLIFYRPYVMKFIRGFIQKIKSKLKKRSTDAT